METFSFFGSISSLPLLSCLVCRVARYFHPSRFNDLLLFLLPLKKKVEEEEKRRTNVILVGSIFFCFYDHPNKISCFLSIYPLKSRSA